jgi:ABC-type sugar transport system permease subunit
MYTLWTLGIKLYACIGIIATPFLCFLMLFPARRFWEICIALSTLFLLVPYWRMFLLHRWAAVIISLLAWFCFIHVMDWFRSKPDAYWPYALLFLWALVPTMALVLAKPIWRSGF